VRCIILAVFALACSITGALADRQYRCDGEIGNGYLPEEINYRSYGIRSFALTLECSERADSGECSYLFNGSRHSGTLLSRTFLLMDYPRQAYLNDNVLLFQMADSPSGVDVNDGQRWYRGICVRID